MKTPQSFEKPNFNSVNLNKTFEEVHDIFDLHQNDINSVSEDIKNLELYFKSRSIMVSFSEIYTSRANSSRYCLKWDTINHEAKEFRLLCQVENFDLNLESFVFKSEDTRPLIECSLPIRMAVYPFLSDFMNSLANTIKIFTREKQKKIELADESVINDIPF